MPIRLNLLAEAQSAEEMRRRDPVKRAIWIAALLIALMLVWSSSLQLKFMLSNKELSHVEGQMNLRTNEYQQVQENRKKSNEVKDKLLRLRELATNRFLNATMLNALQQATADDVQLVHLRVEQTYTYTEETKARTNGNRVLPPKPAMQSERIMLTLDGSDASANPGDQVSKFQDVLATNPYFKESLGKTNLVSLKNQSPPQVNPESGKAMVLFTLECRYPEKTR
jgi:hypothetical protein